MAPRQFRRTRSVIELTTPADAAQPRGYYLADNYSVTDTVAFPAATSLAPGEYALIWATVSPNRPATRTCTPVSISIMAARSPSSGWRGPAANHRLPHVDSARRERELRRCAGWPAGQSSDAARPESAQHEHRTCLRIFINEWMTEHRRHPRSGDNPRRRMTGLNSTTRSDSVDLAAFTSPIIRAPRPSSASRNVVTRSRRRFPAVWADSQTNQNTRLARICM